MRGGIGGEEFRRSPAPNESPDHELFILIQELY
jgi:hypothetical protein